MRVRCAMKSLNSASPAQRTCSARSSPTPWSWDYRPARLLPPCSRQPPPRMRISMACPMTGRRPSATTKRWPITIPRSMPPTPRIRFSQQALRQATRDWKSICILSQSRMAVSAATRRSRLLLLRSTCGNSLPDSPLVPFLRFPRSAMAASLKVVPEMPSCASHLPSKPQVAQDFFSLSRMLRAINGRSPVVWS